MPVQIANNATAALSTSIGSLATDIPVSNVDVFPDVRNADDYFYATIYDTNGNLEIVRVTDKVNNILVAVRGQEGTDPRSWSTFFGTPRIEVRLTAQTLDDLLIDTPRIPEPTMAENGKFLVAQSGEGAWVDF